MSGPISAVTSAYRQAFTYRGRATRSQFWWFLLFAVVVTQALNLGVPGVAPQMVVSLVHVAVVILPLSACLVRRMNDAGRHRGWAWPPIGFLVSGPLLVGLGIADEEALAGLEEGFTFSSALTWVWLAYALMGFGSLPAFIFCFLASAPVPVSRTDEESTGGTPGATKGTRP